MNIKEIQSKILKAMTEVGMEVDYSNDIDLEKDDLNIEEYIHDSFQFISFIMELESEFNIVLPDQYVVIESFRSLKSLSVRIKELIENNSNEK